MRRAQELSDSLLESHAQVKVLPAHFPSCCIQVMPVAEMPSGATAVIWQCLGHIHTHTGHIEEFDACNLPPLPAWRDFICV